MNPVELHPCARCARMQQTCCQRAEILLTEGDLARIQAATEARDFHEWRAPLDSSYTEPDPDDPHWIEWTLRRDGKRRVLLRQSNGDCVFLNSTGCVLSEEVRPLVCRLYPFEYTEKGILGEAAEYCPTEVLQPPAGRMSDLLGMRLESAERWRRMLYEELRQDHQSDANRLNLRPS